MAYFRADTRNLEAGAASVRGALKGAATDAAKSAGEIKRTLGEAGDGAGTAAGKVNALGASLTRAGQASGQLATARAQMEGMARTAVSLAAGGVTAMSALAWGAAKLGSDFEAMTQKWANNSTMTTTQLGQMRAAVLAIGKDTGTSFEQLAEGMQHVTNYGYQGAASVSILSEANKSAVATGASAADTANILANTMHEFGMKTEDAAKAMNVLHLASAMGNTTLQEFDQYAQTALGVAANFGVKLTDVTSALTALTQHGYDMPKAATQVESMIAHIANADQVPGVTKKLEALYRLTGIDLPKAYSAWGLAHYGLHGVLEMTAQAVGHNTSEITKLIPAQRGGFGAMSLIGTAAADYTKALQAQNAVMSGKSDPTQKAYTATMGTAQQQFARLTREVEAGLIPAGEKLLPTLERSIPALQALANDAVQVVIAFSHLPQPVQEAVLGFGAANAASKLLGINLDGAGEQLRKMPGLLGNVTKAMGLAQASETALATEGAAAFAVGGGWMLAIGAAAVAVYGIVRAFDAARDAQRKLGEEHLHNAIVAGTGATRGEMTGEAGKIANMQQQLRAAVTALEAQDKNLHLVASQGGDAQVRAQAAATISTNEALIAQKRKQIADLERDRVSQLGAANALTDTQNRHTELLRQANEQQQIALRRRAQAKDYQTNTVNDLQAREAMALEQQRRGVAGAGGNVQALQSQLASALGTMQRLRAEAVAADAYAGRLRGAAVKIEPKMRAEAASVQGGGVLTSDGGAIGRKIAEVAYARYKDGLYKSYVHMCEGLAHENYKAVTGAYEKVMATRDPHNSALKTLERFKAAGLAQPYTPGMALAPGSLLYSQTLGHGEGHVQTIGPTGQRLDQYGQNHFAPSNFQYYVPPPSASAPAAGKSGAGITSADLARDEAAHAKAEATAKKAAKAHDAELAKGKAWLDNLTEQVALQGDASKVGEVRYMLAHHQLDMLTKDQQKYAMAQAKLSDAKTAKDTGGDDKGTQYLDNLRQEIALLGQDGKAAEVAYSIRHGGIDGLTTAQEGQALSLARLLDANQRFHDAQASLNAQSKDLHETLGLGANATQAQRMAWEFAHQSLDGLTAAQQRAVRGQQAAIVAMQQQADAASSLGDVLDTLKGINQDYAGKSIEAAGGVKAAILEAQKAIADAVAKARETNPGLNVNDAGLQGQMRGILSGALAVDAQKAKSIQEDWLADVTRTTADAREKISGTYTPATKAVEAWLKANKEHIRELSALLGDTRAGEVVARMTAAVAAGAQLDEAAAKADNYRQRMADVQKQYDQIAASSPFEAWKASLLEYNRATGTLGEPFGDDDLKKLYAYQRGLQTMQEVAKGAADALFGALQGAMGPQAGQQQAKDNLKQLQRQAYDLQIKAFQSDSQAKALGIANPYTQQLKTVQGQIDQTQAKLRGMGSSLGAVFGRVFGSIISGFDQMLAKMAMDALKGQVQQGLSSVLAHALGKPPPGGASQTQAAAQQALAAQMALNAQAVGLNTQTVGAGGPLVNGMDGLTAALNTLTATMQAASAGGVSGGGGGASLVGGLAGIASIAGSSPSLSGLGGISSYLGIGSTIAGALGMNGAASLFGTAESLTSSAAGLLSAAPARVAAPVPAAAGAGGTQGALIPPASLVQHIIIQTPNAQSFVQSKSQVAAAAGQAAAQAQKKYGP